MIWANKKNSYGSRITNGDARTLGSMSNSVKSPPKIHSSEKYEVSNQVPKLTEVQRPPTKFEHNLVTQLVCAQPKNSLPKLFSNASQKRSNIPYLPAEPFLSNLFWPKYTLRKHPIKDFGSLFCFCWIYPPRVYPIHHEPCKLPGHLIQLQWRILYLIVITMTHMRCLSQLY